MSEGETLKHRALVRISYALLCDLLDFPEGTVIKATSGDLQGIGQEELVLLVESPSLPAVPSGGVIPYTVAKYREAYGYRGEFEGWGIGA